MAEVESLFSEIGNSIPGAKRGNMFGWQCFKYQKKPFVFFDKNSEQAIVFKLDQNSLMDALDLEGAEIFNPGEKGKPMKNWAVVPVTHSHLWQELAWKAFENIVKEVNHGKR